MFFVLRFRKPGNVIDRVIAGPFATEAEAHEGYHAYQVENDWSHDETDAITLPAAIFEEMTAGVNA